MFRAEVTGCIQCARQFHPLFHSGVFQERRREEERKRREEKEARRIAAEAKAKEVIFIPVFAMFLRLITLCLQEERRLRADAREAERIKEEADRKKLEQERAELRARRLMEREGLLRRCDALHIPSCHTFHLCSFSAIACIL